MTDFNVDIPEPPTGRDLDALLDELCDIRPPVIVLDGEEFFAGDRVRVEHWAVSSDEATGSLGYDAVIARLGRDDYGEGFLYFDEVDAVSGGPTQLRPNLLVGAREFYGGSVGYKVMHAVDQEDQRPIIGYDQDSKPLREGDIAEVVGQYAMGVVRPLAGRYGSGGYTALVDVGAGGGITPEGVQGWVFTNREGEFSDVKLVLARPNVKPVGRDSEHHVLFEGDVVRHKRYGNRLIDAPMVGACEECVGVSDGDVICGRGYFRDLEATLDAARA